LKFNPDIPREYQDMASIYTKLPSDIQGVIRSYVRPIHPVVSMVGIAYNRHIKKGLHDDIVVVNKLAGVRGIEIHWDYSVRDRLDRFITYDRDFVGYIHDTHTDDEIVEKIKGFIYEGIDIMKSLYRCLALSTIHAPHIWPVYPTIADRIDFVNEDFEDYYIMRDNDEITFEAVHPRLQRCVRLLTRP
jgi:hypothetical protein